MPRWLSIALLFCCGGCGVFILWNAIFPQKVKWVTFKCTACGRSERLKDDDIDWMHASAAICPRCNGKQEITEHEE